MPQAPNGQEYHSRSERPDGTIIYRDAAGNEVFSGRQTTDPETNQTYWETGDTYQEGTGGVGPRGHIRAARRAKRQGRRSREQEQREQRANYYGGLANEATQGIDDPWMELAGATPSVDDLAGPALTSELAGAQADPQSIAAQQAALQQMARISQGRRSAQEEASLQQARANTAQYERQQREAIIQQAALRGMQGAGTTLGAQLQAQQAGANRMSQAEMNAQAAIEQRALQAMAMRGQMAGQMRGQSFGEDVTRRGGQDDTNRFNSNKQTDAVRDRWGMQATSAQGLSQARATQGEQNREAQQNALAKPTTTEKRTKMAEPFTSLVNS